MFEYHAKVLEVTDGDTLDLLVDLGFDPVYRRLKRARLYGIDAPEKNTAAGKRAKEFLVNLLPVGTMIRVNTIKIKSGGEKVEKYGGYLVIIHMIDDDEDDPGTLSLNDKIIAAGHAKPYFGGKRV